MNQDSSQSGDHTISVKGAADRLQRAVASLSAALTPLTARLDTLESQSVGQARLEEDRAKLTGELDSALADAKAAKTAQEDAEARARDMQKREQEFSLLADQTMKEMDLVISQVKLALGKD